MMRTLIAIAALVVSISAVAQSQVPNVFEDGTPASAAAVNENFQYVLENASGGCSATQQDNSVVIECADGTSGVIAGAGTTIVIPEGDATVPTETYASGDILLVDDNEVILAKVHGGGAREYLVLIDAPSASGKDNTIYAHMKNDNENERVTLLGVEWLDIYFNQANCSGAKFTSNFAWLIAWNESLYFGDRYAPTATILTKSYFRNGECFNSENVASNLSVLLEYTPAPEILNAAYPARLEQLP